jgi:hypothetical protein
MGRGQLSQVSRKSAKPRAPGTQLIADIMLGANVLSVIVAVSSSAVAITLAVFSFYERYRREKQETLIHALEYLTGGSQNLSVGIALIEGLWYGGHPNHRAVIPALTNQAVYLLLQTTSKGRHQFHN